MTKIYQTTGIFVLYEFFLTLVYISILYCFSLLRLMINPNNYDKKKRKEELQKNTKFLGEWVTPKVTFNSSFTPEKKKNKNNRYTYVDTQIGAHTCSKLFDTCNKGLQMRNEAVGFWRFSGATNDTTWPHCTPAMPIETTAPQSAF